MKIEGTRKAGASNQHTLYVISFGKQELELITALLNQANSLTPAMRGIDNYNMQYKGRLNNLSKGFYKLLNPKSL